MPAISTSVPTGVPIEVNKEKRLQHFCWNPLIFIAGVDGSRIRYPLRNNLGVSQRVPLLPCVLHSRLKHHTLARPRSSSTRSTKRLDDELPRAAKVTFTRVDQDYVYKQFDGKFPQIPCNDKKSHHQP